MATSTNFYRIYLKEPVRKYLGINLKKKKIYMFIVNNKMYLSTDAIPKNKKIYKLTVKLGLYSWFIDIPTNYAIYQPTSYKLLNTANKVLELVQ